MKNTAVFLEQEKILKVKDIELPELTEGLLLEVYAAGVCGTDPHIIDGSRSTALPIVMGHEFYGRIVEISSNCHVNITKGSLEKNKLITIVPGKICGICYYCINYPGQEHLCISRKIYGVNLQSNAFPYATGGFSQYVIIRNGYHVHPVPDDWEWGLGVLLEPFSVGIRAAYKAIEYHKIKLNDSSKRYKAVIQGLGTIGMSILLTLSNFKNIDIYVVEPIDHRLNLAIKYGAKAVFKLDDSSYFFDDIKNKLSIPGFDMVFESAGTLEAVNQSFLLVRRGGCIIEVGNFADVGSISLSPSFICRNDIAFIGSVLGEPYLYEHAEALINKIKNNAKDFLGPVYNIHEVSNAIDNVEKTKHGLKTLIALKK